MHAELELQAAVRDAIDSVKHGTAVNRVELSTGEIFCIVVTATVDGVVTYMCEPMPDGAFRDDSAIADFLRRSCSHICGDPMCFYHYRRNPAGLAVTCRYCDQVSYCTTDCEMRAASHHKPCCRTLCPRTPSPVVGKGVAGANKPSARLLEYVRNMFFEYYPWTWDEVQRQRGIYLRDGVIDYTRIPRDSV